MSDFVVPDLIEPIIGWRVWAAEMVYTRDGRLALGLNSLYYPMHWHADRPVVATCEHSSSAPCDDDDHLCGIHAVPTVNHASIYLPSRVRRPHEWAHHATQVVLGTVELEGHVAVHGDGWRAERARPHTLFVPTFFKARGADIYAQEACEMLEWHYGVRARLFRDWRDIAPPTRLAA